MMKYKFFKVILVLIAVLLFLNLFNERISSFLAHEAVAEKAQALPFRGNGVGVACSGSGQYVFAVGSSGIFRSKDYGKAGSWEVVVK